MAIPLLSLPFASINLGSLSLASLPLLAQGMLPGCQLINGNLQCVPGQQLTPQQQITVLEQQIDSNLQLENQIQQSINSLGQLLVSGNAAAGELLSAAWIAKPGMGQQPLAVHWYRQGASGWLLIPGTQGLKYQPTAQDKGLKLMAVATVSTPNGNNRVASQALGPVVLTGP